MVWGTKKMKARQRARQNAKKPVQQYYGGTPQASDALRARNQEGINAGTALEREGLAGLDAERANAGAMLTHLGQQVSGERNTAGQQLGAISDNAQRLQRQQARNASSYGRGADTALSDYAAGRGATLANAAALEKGATDAAGRYQSAADAAEKASQQRTQQQALSLAAGRGNDAIRTALAAATSANRDAALQNQVTRANEMNALLGFEADSRARAADIRAGVGNADQGAANIQSGRQQVATNATGDLLRSRGDLAKADADIGLSALGARTGIATADAQLGTGVQGTKVNAGANQRGDFLGAEGTQESAQLGANMDYEEKRRAANKGPVFKAGSILFDPANLFNRDKTI